MDIDTNNIFPKTKIGRDHQLRDAFRHGKIIDRKIDEETKRPVVRVQFLDKQGLISYWLPIKQFGSRLTSHFYVPKIGDDVNVNLLANGVENGFVDGSYFNKNNPIWFRMIEKGLSAQTASLPDDCIGSPNSSTRRSCSSMAAWAHPRRRRPSATRASTSCASSSSTTRASR
jgi:hypothetical protein